MSELVSTPFDRNSTALDVIDGIDLTGKQAIVTGASSGIGIETARALATAGAAVTLAVRSTRTGQDVADDIVSTSINPNVTVSEIDLSNIGSVDAFVDRWNEPLHILVNNAGVMSTPETYTDDGWELQFAINHLGHFALATGLHTSLTAAGDARIVSVASSGHGNADIDFDDLFFAERPYDPGIAYGQSKTAQILFAVEASRRWKRDGITANALMPGGIWTNLQRHWPPDTLAAMKQQMAAGAHRTMKTPEQGAATAVMLATSPLLGGVGGRYFDDCNEAPIVDEIIDGLHGVRAYALDPARARQLWTTSINLLAQARTRQN